MQRSLSCAIANFVYSSNFCGGAPTGFVHCATEVGPGTLSSATLGQESSNLTFFSGIGKKYVRAYSVYFGCCGKILVDIRVATIVNQLVQGQSELHPDIICLLIEMLSAALGDRLDLAFLLGLLVLLPTFS